jgi:hypothetical protein
MAGRLAFSGLENFAVSQSQGGPRACEAPQELVSKALEQGFERGYAAGAAHASADADLRLQNVRVEFDTMLNEERRLWQLQTADKLCDALQSGVEIFGDALEDRVAVLLKPWLAKRLLDKSILALHEAIDRSIGNGMSIEICGCEPLVGAIRERLGGKAYSVTTRISDEPLLVVRCGDTIFTANFADWSSQLEAAHE